MAAPLIYLTGSHHPYTPIPIAYELFLPPQTHQSQPAVWQVGFGK